MTRVLAELLEADQPRFGMTVQHLEQATGKPSNDIRLTSEILQRAQRKLHALGLDPHDTTGRELYQALLQRFHYDEKLAREALHVSLESAQRDVYTAVIKFIEKNVPKHTSLALKNSVAKRLLKKIPPKRAMKQLGYRSLDSMLKHEAVAHLYVAAFFCESLAWRKKFLEQYAKLQPKDFELRDIDISVPQAARWAQITEHASRHYQHPIVVFKELGTVVVLSGEKNISGNVITMLTLLLSALNDINSATSFLKLQQMKPDFGTFVQNIAEKEPLTHAELVDRPVPWRVVHQYYARFTQAYNPVIFEPHIHPTDLEWYHPEALLTKLHPALDFWKDTRYTAYTQNSEKVSLNVFDVARNYSNHIPFAKRTLQAIRQSLWQELMIRYLDHANVEQAIAGELATEPVFTELDDY